MTRRQATSRQDAKRVDHRCHKQLKVLAMFVRDQFDRCMQYAQAVTDVLARTVAIKLLAFVPILR